MTNCNLQLIFKLFISIFILMIFSTNADDVEVLLRDSTIIKGKLVKISRRNVVIHNSVLGKICIKRDMILEPKFKPDMRMFEYFNDLHNQLAYIPTANLPEKGTIDISSYYFLYYLSQIAITNYTTININSILPVFRNYKDIQLGATQQVYKSKNNSFASAISASINKPDRLDQRYVNIITNISALFSYSIENRMGCHLNIGYIYKKINKGFYATKSGMLYRLSDKENLHGFDYGLGIEYRPHPNIKIMVENFNDFGYIRTSDIQGTLFTSVAIRAMWRKISFDVGLLHMKSVNHEINYVLSAFAPNASIHLMLYPF